MQHSLLQAVDALFRSSGADPVAYQTAYDQCLWMIVTASRGELDELVRRFPEEPYLSMPIPLQVTAARLLGLEHPSDVDTLQLADGWISMYCDPVEEESATHGIRARRQLAAGAEQIAAGDVRPAIAQE